MCWSRLILHHSHTCFSSLAKSNGSLISCIRFLGSVFGMVPPVPTQQEDSAEDMPQKGVRIAPKEGVPEVGGAAPAKHRINTNLSRAICACEGGTRTRVNVTNKGMSQVTCKGRRRQAQGKPNYMLPQAAVVRCRHTSHI